MARSGNASDWQHRLAAQRQEDERLARERRRQERDREKARQDEHLESQHQAAEEQTAAVQEQIKNLEEVLTSVLPLPPMSFDRLMATPRTPGFEPGPLGVAVPGPDWSDFAPAPPGGLLRFLRRAARFKRRTAQARGRFEAAAAEHREHESQRQQALAVARAKYHKKVTQARARAAARNAYVASRQSAFARGETESVQWFGRCVLKASRYPDGFPREYQVAYDRQTRSVTVEFELPPQDVIPPVRGYRYVKARDAVEPLPRREDEISERYERLISAIALRTVHEIFSATPPDIIRAVSFTGYVSTTDRATGKPVRPHLLAVSAERPVFENLVLAEVEPAACLAGLGAVTPGVTPAVTPAAAEPARGGWLELGVAFGGFEQVHQGAERFEIGPGLLH
jgi:restriction system protein